MNVSEFRTRKIQRITAWLGESGSTASLAKLMGGSLGVQLLLLLATPLLTRLFTAADFGVLGVFLSLASIGGAVATLRYEMAIVVAPGRVASRCLFWLAAAATVSNCVLAAMVVWLAPGLLDWIRGGETIRTYAWLLPLAVLISATGLTLSRVASKCNAFGRMSAAMLAGRSADVAIKIVLGAAFNLGGFGLILGFVVGELIRVVLLIVTLKEWNWRPPLRWKLYRRQFCKYIDFPRYTLPGGFLSALINSLPVIAFAAVFGPAFAGYMELARRVLGRPMSVLGNKYHTVFYQKSADQFSSRGSIACMVENHLAFLVLLGSGPFLLVGLFGGPLFGLILGSDYTEAGHYAALLAPAWYLRSIATPIRVFNTLGRQAVAFRWQIGHLLLICGALGLGTAFGSPYLTIVFLSCATSLAYLYHLNLTIRLSGASCQNVFLQTFRIVSLSFWKAEAKRALIQDRRP